MVGDNADEVVVSIVEEFQAAFLFEAVAFGAGCTCPEGGEESKATWLGGLGTRGTSDLKGVWGGCVLGDFWVGSVIGSWVVVGDD